jgi:hypothetical protein
MPRTYTPSPGTPGTGRGEGQIANRNSQIKNSPPLREAAVHIPTLAVAADLPPNRWRV